MIPDDSPFAHDLLDREEPIRTLSRVLAALSGPGVIAVDAGWGMGKTTFLRMWAQYLRLEGFRVTDFNAWRTDFVREPFLALSAELTEALTTMTELEGRAPLHRFKQSAARVARAAGLPTARVAASAIPGVGSQVASELSPGYRSARGLESEHYIETTRAHEEFRRSLAEAADQVAAATDDRPWVVMIDELDRCRPTYAIELLELAKHLFNVDHVLFVLCLNREQLAQSVKAIYGEGFDASAYLGRFFDIDYRLPSPDREMFIRTALASSGIQNDIAATKRGWFGGSAPDFHTEVLPVILDRPQLSLREIQQTVQRLAVVLASIPKDEGIYAETLSVLLVLRTLNAPLYRRLVSGEETDANAVDAFAGGGRERANTKPERQATTVVESILCAAACLASANHRREPDPQNHPLLTSYSDDVARGLEAAKQGIGGPEAQVVEFIEKHCEYSARPSAAHRGQILDQINFHNSLKQLELFPEPPQNLHLA